MLKSNSSQRNTSQRRNNTTLYANETWKTWEAGKCWSECAENNITYPTMKMWIGKTFQKLFWLAAMGQIVLCL